MEVSDTLKVNLHRSSKKQLKAAFQPYVERLHSPELEESSEAASRKNDAITKLFNAAGSVPAVKYDAEAEKYRAEAARLREELAQLENQPQPTANIPTH